MKKYNLEIKHEIVLQEENLEELKNRIANTDIMLIGNDTSKLLNMKEVMETAKKDFNEKVKEALIEFDNKYNLLKETIDEVENRVLDYAQKTGTIKESIKLDKEGIAYKEQEFNVDLPKGFVYVSGTTSFDYDESKINDDKYYKKELRKNDVKKAVKEGLLPSEVLIPKRSDPSIRMESKKMVE